MSLYVETTDPNLLPADIYEATRYNEGGYTVPLQIHQDLTCYQGITCNKCGEQVSGHDWIAVDRTDTATRVLRCSNAESR